MKEFKLLNTRQKKYFQCFYSFFTSPSIVDAFVSNKRIVSVQNDLMGQGWINQIQRYQKISGIQKLILPTDII